jgi:O-antigen/teichoic acid export membrane protein
MRHPPGAADRMEPSAQSLTSRTARAAQWRFSGSIIGAALQFSVGVLLARLLTPRDFGVSALASLVMGLARLLGDLGMGSAVVQRAVLTDRHIRTAFTLSALVGLATAVLIALAAPLGAAVMQEPILIPVLRAFSTIFLAGGLSSVAASLLRKRLDFTRQFFIDIGTYVFGYALVATSLATLGFGVWSLVWGGLAQSFLTSTALILLVRHPLRPLLGRRELEDLLGFGIGATLNAFASYVAVQIDTFIVGRWSGVASLGLYNRAYTLMELPYTRVTRVVSGVLLPALAQVQGEPERMRRAYLFATQLTAIVAGPAMGVMVISAPLFVPSVYGPQWMGAVLPLQLLCVAGYARALYPLGGMVARSVGRVYAELGFQIVYAVLVMIGALAGIRYGLSGVAIGVGGAIVCMFIAMTQLALRITATTWGAYLRVQLFATGMTALTTGVALGLRGLFEAMELARVIVLTGMMAGASLTWVLGVVWKLGEPDFGPLRDRLPRGVLLIVERTGRWRHSWRPRTVSSKYR